MRLSPEQDARQCHNLIVNKDGSRTHFTVDEFKDKFHGQGVLVYDNSVAAAARTLQAPYDSLDAAARERRATFFAKGDAQATASPHRAQGYCLIKLLPNGTAEVTNGLTGHPINAKFENLSAEQIAEQRRELTPTEMGIARGKLDSQNPEVLGALRAELKARADIAPTPQTPKEAPEISR